MSVDIGSELPLKGSDTRFFLFLHFVRREPGLTATRRHDGESDIGKCRSI